ncbi:DsbC family protein [Henriciella pelagia]|uniref:DsbC family protein n=1 Tax=Henriciella pelagia TaxID=1977912 RepID=UPI003511CA7B
MSEDTHNQSAANAKPLLGGRNLTILVAAVTGVLGFVGGSLVSSLDSASPDDIRASIGSVIPGANVTSVDCGVGGDVCEVLIEDTVLYVDRTGRYAFAGSMLDLHERIDLTAQRQEELERFAALTGTRRVAAAAGSAGTAVRQPAQPAPPQNDFGPELSTVDVTLPIENAVVYNGGQDLPVIHVFADLTCPYCQRLHAEFASIEGYEIREYFVDWLGRGGGERARLVLCADDRAAAASEMYAGGNVGVTRPCEECDAEYAGIVEQNTAFAQSFGMRGTPTMVHEDGRRYQGGYAPAATVLAWASAS